MKTSEIANPELLNFIFFGTLSEIKAEEISKISSRNLQILLEIIAIKKAYKYL